MPQAELGNQALSIPGDKTRDAYILLVSFPYYKLRFAKVLLVLDSNRTIGYWVRHRFEAVLINGTKLTVLVLHPTILKRRSVSRRIDIGTRIVRVQYLYYSIRLATYTYSTRSVHPCSMSTVGSRSRD